MFGSFEKLDAEIDALPPVAEDRPDAIDQALDELFARVLVRLERETVRYAPGLVRARLPLARGCAGRDVGGGAGRSVAGCPSGPRCGAAHRALQVVLRQARPYLMAKAHPQGALWDFYHRSFWKAVGRTYFADADAREQAHAELARYSKVSPPGSMAGG